MCAAMIYTIPSLPILQSNFPYYGLEQWSLDDVESETLDDYLLSEYQTNTTYPTFDLIFNAFHLTPLASIKVVILGQDPYPSVYKGPDIHGNPICIPKATGLAFSVPPDIPIDKIPYSLKNIFAEVEKNGFLPPKSGCLENWARQGVLLLNSALTVRERVRASHAKVWKTFTDNVIRNISATVNHVVFILWGVNAKKKRPMIEQAGSTIMQNGTSVLRHTILEAGHPSPCSVKYFAGCGHFLQCNTALRNHGQDPINWSL